jgi:CRISPR-associated endoribonuclease Cas6/Csy4 subtype I-F
MMVPQAYFDLELRRVEGTPAPVALAAVWRKVHQAAAAAHIPFVVAFPRYGDGPTLGDVMRVFCESIDAAGELIDACGTRLDDAAVVRRPKAVPADIQRHEAYLMRRITGRKHRPEMQAGMEALRARQIALQADMPFAWMRSSTGLGYKLVVERVPATPAQHAAPNGYGLSRRSAVVAVPVF